MHIESGDVPPTTLHKKNRRRRLTEKVVMHIIDGKGLSVSTQASPFQKKSSKKRKKHGQTLDGSSDCELSDDLRASVPQTLAIGFCATNRHEEGKQ